MAWEMEVVYAIYHCIAMALLDHFLPPGECLYAYICGAWTHIDHMLNHLCWALKWTVMYYQCLPLPHYNRVMQYHTQSKALTQFTFGHILLVMVGGTNAGCTREEHGVIGER